MENGKQIRVPSTSLGFGTPETRMVKRSLLRRLPKVERVCYWFLECSGCPGWYEVREVVAERL